MMLPEFQMQKQITAHTFPKLTGSDSAYNLPPTLRYPNTFWHGELIGWWLCGSRCNGVRPKPLNWSVLSSFLLCFWSFWTTRIQHRLKDSSSSIDEPEHWGQQRKNCHQNSLFKDPCRSNTVLPVNKLLYKSHKDNQSNSYSLWQQVFRIWHTYSLSVHKNMLFLR